MRGVHPGLPLPGEGAHSYDHINKDVSIGRPRWGGNFFFLMASIGSSVGLGNIWRFPSLTWKYGGEVFLPTYFFVLMLIGVPMLILEIALGQKLQSGAAKAFGGISPRFYGVGGASTVIGFFTASFYAVLLGVALLFAAETNKAAGDSSKLPWAEQNLNRPASCKTASTYAQSPAQMYFYLNVTTLYTQNDCRPWKFSELEQTTFSGSLALYTGITWFCVFLGVVAGPTSIKYVATVTVMVKIVMLFVCFALYFEMAKAWGVNGSDYFFGILPWTQPDGTVYDKRAALFQIYKDAYSMVFFSVGTCVGVFTTYGSFRRIRQPVIGVAFLIAMVDFVYSIVASFIIWSGLAVLLVKGDEARAQTSSSGLTFIAFPRLAEVAGNSKSYMLFCLLLWFAGIDSAISYIFATIQMYKDMSPGCPYPILALVVCLAACGFSMMFCTNWGWIMFDLIDHYISDYGVILVGLLQCISVGWVLEASNTANKTQFHHKALKTLGACFWTPVVTISIFANFGFAEFGRAIGAGANFIILLIAMLASYCSSGLPFGLWYHEVFMAGVSKLSWSVTSISYPDDDIEYRAWWMSSFEAYFGIAIKYLNPALLTFLLMENLAADMKSPYAEQPAIMQVFACVALYIILLWIFVPMFTSDIDIDFEHDPNIEFMADEIHDLKLRLGRNANDARLLALRYADRPLPAKTDPNETMDGDTEMIPIKKAQVAVIQSADKQLK